MQQWMIYCDRAYDATPWPYAVSWDVFTRAPLPLVNACVDVTRVSPTDGKQEAIVPGDLPRPIPKGAYRFAIHYDDQWLYALLESIDATVVTPWTKSASMLATLQLLSNDGHFTLGFRGFRRSDGAPAEPAVASVSAAGYGPRQPAAVKRVFDWGFAATVSGGREVACWRVRRAEVADTTEGSRLRVSISRTNLETIEGVSWGGYHLWGPRPDEFGTVRLVSGPDAHAAPRVRRVDLHYDTASERGHLRMHWENVRDAGEAVTALHPVGFEAPLDVCGVWVNDQATRIAITPTLDTQAIDWPDGHNRIVIASATASSVRFTLEKCSGNHIRAGSLPAVEPASDEDVRKRIRADCERAIAEHHQRKASGEHMNYQVSRSLRACALARAYRHLDRDERLLEVVRSEADVMLTFQRADGSFAGNHMQTRTGKPPTQAWAGGGYDSGPAGELWVLASLLTGDEKYLAASRRLLDAWSMYRVEFNHNFAGIGLYHLATHYRLTREPAALERALHHARHCVAVDFLPLGFQGGHNYYTVYGGLTLRGLAMLASVLPTNDPYRATLTEICVRMTNQIITRLQGNGLVDARDRYYVGMPLTHYKFWWSMLAVSLLVPADEALRIDGVFSQMTRLAGDDLGWCDSDVIRYAAHRGALLAGESLDLMSMH